MEVEKHDYPKDVWNLKYTLFKNEGAISTSTWYFFVLLETPVSGHIIFSNASYVMGGHSSWIWKYDFWLNHFGRYICYLYFLMNFCNL